MNKSKKPHISILLVLGIVLGMGISIALHQASSQLDRYIGLVENMRFKTDAQQPVIKAFRVKDFILWEGSTYLKFEFVKIRDCGAPISLSITYTTNDGNVKTIANYENMNEQGQTFSGFGIRPVLPDEWQETSWFRIDDELRNTNIFLTLSNACSVKYYDELVEKRFEPSYSTAIDIVVKTYGPFALVNPVEKNPFE